MTHRGFMTTPLKVGLAGLGTVGASVVRLIDQQRSALALRCGRPIEIVAVTARSKAKNRGVELRRFRWVKDPIALARDPGIDVFVELIGGAGDPARRAVETALAAGKSVVTATISIGRPQRSVSAARCCSIRRTTDAPTVPRPASPTFSGVAMKRPD